MITFLSVSALGCAVIGTVVVHARYGLMGGFVRACYWLAARMAAFAVAVEAGHNTYTAELAGTSLKPGLSEGKYETTTVLADRT